MDRRHSFFSFLADHSQLFLLATAFLLSPLLCAQTPWTLRNQRAGGDALWGITSGPGGLVAVGTNGAVLQSTDGGVWTRRTSNTTDWLTAVSFGKGRYIAVGDGGRILGSTDGVTWANVPQSATTQRLNNVFFAQNKFVAVGENGTILWSNDGVAWTAAASGTTRWLRGLAWGQSLADVGLSIFNISQWTATGQAGTILISSDGVTWKTRQSGVTTDLEAVTFISGSYYRFFNTPAYDDVVFAAIGQSGTMYLLTTVWTQEIVPETAIALNPGSRFRCLVSGAHYLVSWLNLNGASSETHGEQTAPVVAIDESGGVFTAYGVAHADGTTFTNYDSTQAPITNPASWTRETLSPTANLRSATYVAGQESFYAVGENETIYRRDQVFDGRLGNLSTRGFVDQGEKALAAGFVIRGSTPKSVLLRGIGPTLGSFGLTGGLNQPTLTVFDSAGHPIAVNTGWTSNADPTAIANAGTRAGAFPLPANSGDSALRLSLTPGLYTALVSGAAGTSGLALVEIYDLDERVSGYARAINLSSRGLVGSGANVLIAGVNVQGPARRTFLVRGVGPSLTKFGVANVLTDPALSITLQNPNLETGRLAKEFAVSPDRDPALISAATNAVGAFALDPGGQDDAMIVRLPSGTYTFQVSSKSNSTGIALIEVYEIGVSQ